MRDLLLLLLLGVAGYLAYDDYSRVVVLHGQSPVILRGAYLADIPPFEHQISWDISGARQRAGGKGVAVSDINHDGCVIQR